MNVIALLPIKHHSSRVPGKNYRLMNKKPLYWYVLNTLSKTNVNRIIINIDHQELADEIQKVFPNVEMYMRPDKLKGDDVSTNLLFMDMIVQLGLDNLGLHKDNNIFLQTHITNPLVTVETYNKVIQSYITHVIDGDCDTLFTAKRLQTRLYSKDGNAINHNPKELIPTQDLDPIYEENSCIYVFDYDTMKLNNHRIGKHAYIYEMSDFESQDIDYEFDFIVTEVMMSLKNGDETNKEKTNEDKTIIVTGSSGGIGSAICKKFKTLGWNVVGVDINPGPLTTHICDISKLTECKKLIEGLGSIDLLVNNAAIQICKEWSSYSLSDWDKTMNVNIKAPYMLSVLCKEQMKSGSSIVNISSVHSISTSNNIGPYAVSKGSLLSLTKSMGLEFIKYGININSISPGAIDTDMLARGSSDRTDLKKLINSTPIKRLGKPEEIAEAVLFLHQNKFIVGENLVIDGGATIKLSTE